MAFPTAHFLRYRVRQLAAWLLVLICLPRLAHGQSAASPPFPQDDVRRPRIGLVLSGAVRVATRISGC